MLIGYPAPAVNNIALAGATWLTADGGAALIDGNPARVARMQQTAGNPAITLTFTSAFVPRIICLLGLTCAPGTIVNAAAADGGALGGNSAGQAAVQLADGSVACWLVTAGTVTTDSVRVTIDSAGTFDVGELAVMPAVDVSHQTDWAEEPIDPSESQRTRGGQLATSFRRAYRQLRVAFTPASLSEVRGGGLAGGMDWQRLQAAVLGNRRVAAIPRWVSPAGVIDVAELHRTAVYGVAKPGGSAHLGGNYYGSGNGWTFEEVPPI